MRDAATKKEVGKDQASGETLPLSQTKISAADSPESLFDFLHTQPTATTPARPSIPGYDLLRVLGHGGMGIVYLARQTRLDRMVALKMIYGGMEPRAEDVERFQSEAQAIARLQHPNIVQLHELGEFEGKPYFSIEYVAGGNLAERTGGQPQPPRLAAELLETLARAVHYAHSQGIVHRDLKPANILLQDPDTQTTSEDLPGTKKALRLLADAIPKVTDFGLARLMTRDSRLTRTGEVLGTPSYMSPEQAQGLVGTLGPSVDIYALGAILYELLTGRPPFQGVTPMDTLLLASTCEPASPTVFQPKLPRDLVTICMRCLQKEPSKRYATAEALADDLRRFLSDQPIQARPVSGLEKLLRWSRRNPALAGTLTTLAVVLCAGIVGITFLWLYAEAKRQSAENSESKARAALFLAEQREAEATAAKDGAERNLDRALRAIDQTLVKVAEMKQAQLPQFEPERIALLEGALAILNETLEENATSLEAKRQAAEVCRRVAEIHRQLGNLQEGEAAYVRGLDLCRQLVEQAPNNFDGQLSLLNLAKGFASFRSLQLRHADAAALQQEAVQVAEKLVNMPSGNGLAPFHLGNTRNDLGSYYLLAGDARRALPILEESISEMRATEELSLIDKMKLSHAFATLGRAQGETGQTEKGEASFRAAVALAEECLASDPKNIDMVSDTGARHANFGTYLSFIPKLEEALREFERANELHREAAAARPHHPQLRSAIAETLMNMAVIHFRFSDFEAMRKVCSEVAAINEKLFQEHPEVPTYRLSYVRGLQLQGIATLQQGQREEGVQLLTQALESATKNTELFTNSVEAAMQPGQLQVVFAEIAMAQGNSSEARRRVGLAIELYQKAKLRFPGNKLIEDHLDGIKQLLSIIPNPGP